jgi:hypothetical protein
LVPEPDLEAELVSHVTRICAALGCPPHAPHLTVLGDVLVDAALAAAAIDGLASSTPTLVLDPRGLATSPARFQALTVRFEPHPAFLALSAELRGRLGLPAAPAGDPHVSLAYPRPPFDPARLAPLAGGVPLARRYRFDRLVLVDPGPGRGDWEDVAAWRTLRWAPLAQRVV